MISEVGILFGGGDDFVSSEKFELTQGSKFFFELPLCLGHQGFLITELSKDELVAWNIPRVCKVNEKELEKSKKEEKYIRKSKRKKLCMKLL